MPIKSFRGLIADGAQQTISLHTNNGAIGYRIKKLEVFPQKPGQESVESTVLVWTKEQTSVSTTAVTVKQTAVDGVVDFSDQTLIGAACFHDSSSESNLNPLYVVFDNITFNQDIYITHTDTNSAIPINWYIEVEQVKLDLNQNTVATLKDIRNITA